MPGRSGSRVYQDLALADNLSAAANVFLGRELKRKFGPFAFLDHKAMAAWALESCARRPVRTTS